MQPVTSSNIQNPLTTAVQKGSSGQNKKPVVAADNGLKGNALTLSEDIVTLSTSALNSADNKEPSTPVSNAEKEALRQNSTGTMSFSIYA